MKQKSSKKVYSNQKEVLESFQEFILPKLKDIPEIEKALLWGSLINNSFGVYSEPFEGHMASDVDLIVFLRQKASVPNHFKYLDVNKTWFKGYKSNNFRKFIHQGNFHKVDILLVKPEYNEKFVRDRIKRIKGGKLKLIYKKIK